MAGNTTGPNRYNWTIEKIEARGQKEGDCIIYTGKSLHRQGYPMQRFEGEMRTISSVIAQLKYGKVPNRESRDKVTRTCKNIKCINSEHTVIMNTSQIMKRATQTGKTTLLNADQVRAIRKEYAYNPYRGAQNDLAKKYGVDCRIIWSVVRNRLYKWVK